ncbi:hypothetical protein FR483_n250R [Paramecium bursaria Chlorella virus FR483]|uniref:Uncharacterized protein n250R n=1 Tax=Paramecium bursaria Chlorella virus FR483 TaxID=399781 RepID=A7J6V4_PBCVF|nr:hypothetical protein FR483_n250R [Paramecium bursaria Chlorella virus FR483]ABT15535.1 hypothetical protein FR483_n250R [Paramecium bursaria Chlorella virus FR483]
MEDTRQRRTIAKEVISRYIATCYYRIDREVSADVCYYASKERTITNEVICFYIASSKHLGGIYRIGCDDVI